MKGGFFCTKSRRKEELPFFLCAGGGGRVSLFCASGRRTEQSLTNPRMEERKERKQAGRSIDRSISFWCIREATHPTAALVPSLVLASPLKDLEASLISSHLISLSLSPSYFTLLYFAWLTSKCTTYSSSFPSFQITKFFHPTLEASVSSHLISSWIPQVLSKRTNKTHFLSLTLSRT